MRSVPRPSISVCALVLSALSLSAGLGAQDRIVSVAGRLRDSAGRPIAGADVVLAAAPRFIGERGDRVVTRSGENGRFRVRADLGYRAWARWKSAAGELRFSRVEDANGSTRRLLLVEAPSPPALERIDFVGRDLWRAHG